VITTDWVYGEIDAARRELEDVVGGDGMVNLRTALDFATVPAGPGP